MRLHHLSSRKEEREVVLENRPEKVMVFTAGAAAHAEVRLIQNVVDPGHSGASQHSLRLWLSRPGDILNRPRFALVCIANNETVQMKDGRPVAVCRDFRHAQRKLRPIPKRRRASKPKAQKERTHSLIARGDDVLNRLQFCVRASVCGKTDPRLATISKNLHFPCRFLPSRWKYTVEDMEDSIYKKYGIDPNRIPTDAEVELVAYCFDVSLEEARSILSHRCMRSDATQEDFVNNHETRQKVRPESAVANKHG